MSSLEKKADGFYFIDPPPGGAVIAAAGKEANRINYNQSSAAVRAAERALLSEHTGIPEKNILFLEQEHGDRVAPVEGYPPETVDFFAVADAMITSLPGLCLVIRTADCVPVFLYDPNRKTAAAVHSGWRGLKAEIAHKTVRLMVEEWGSDPENISACILPAAGPGAYEVQEDVARFFPDHIENRDGCVFLDLAAGTADSLKSAGVSPHRIFSSGLCTIENNSLFYSHRRGDAGRNLNFIVTPGGRR